MNIGPSSTRDGELQIQTDPRILKYKFGSLAKINRINAEIDISASSKKVFPIPQSALSASNATPRVPPPTPVIPTPCVDMAHIDPYYLCNSLASSRPPYIYFTGAVSVPVKPRNQDTQLNIAIPATVLLLKRETTHETCDEEVREGVSPGPGGKEEATFKI